jgi:hypothetical protein
MQLSPRNDDYFCVKCYATGRMPVVEGNAYCPQCGELVWIVKPLVHTEAMAPDYRLPIKAHRPPLRLRGRWLARLCVIFFRPLVRRWLNWKEERFNFEVNQKLKQLQKCKSRKEYERVLGRPVCTVTGKGTGTLRSDGTLDSPDLIEYYSSGSCTIGLCFRDDKLQDIFGSMKLTVLYLEFSRSNPASATFGIGRNRL